MFVVKYQEPVLPRKEKPSQIQLHERSFPQKTEKIDFHVLLADLKACSKARDLQRGKKVHTKAKECGYGSNIYVMTTLVRMYARCGSIVEARLVFDSIQEPDLVCWNALLLGYAENGEGLVALDLFSRMKASGYTPTSLTYVAALKACASLAGDGDSRGKKSCLERGRQIHSEIGSNFNHYVQNTLIDMYTKCGSMGDAHSVFDSIQRPDVVSWNILLLGYAENGDGLVALDLFSKMKASGFVPSDVTYVAVLKACASLAVDGDVGIRKNCLERGRQIHTEVGNNLSCYIQNTLIDMYSKCGSMVDARRVFESMKRRDIVSWNALLLGYAENGEGAVALDLFSKMKVSGCTPDSVTQIAALKACTSLAEDGDGNGKMNCLKRGREIHLEIGSDLDHHVLSKLIDMYAKSGRMVEAGHVFDSIHDPDVVCWNALLLGYAENGEGLVALDMFAVMKASGCAPNPLTYVAALKACGLIGSFTLGRDLHSEITEFTAHVVTSLVDCYGKCGSMVEAHEVFRLHPKVRHITTWNALLAGYGSYGDIDSVFNVFEAMQHEEFEPDAVTFLCFLSCCSHAGLVEKARECFDGMNVRYGVTPTVTHYTCMVDVLGRANLLNEAVVLLQKMPCNPGTVTWITLLGACCKWKNVEIGRIAFQCLVSQDEKVSAAYVLMAHIYGSKGMREQQERVLEAGSKMVPILAPNIMDSTGCSI